ncbi:MAG: class I SAM-dependent methyltransferase [Saprospiraceae bacterium]
MPNYLSYQFQDSPNFVNTYDELPLWSAPFGLLLLQHLELKPNLTVLDLGSGTGFPLLELAGRLGKSCKLYGIDPWTNANQRARQKIANYALDNVEIVACSAEQMPFADQSVDLIVSNLGLNNFAQPQVVLRECRRVLKPGGKLALTTNLNGHWKEFYDRFESTLQDLGKAEIIAQLTAQQEHRGTVASITKLLTDHGFQSSRHYTDRFEMRFLDGSAFLNHHFIKLGWLSEWRDLLPPADREASFSALEQNLNAYAQSSGGLSLTVPVAFIEVVAA